MDAKLISLIRNQNGKMITKKCEKNHTPQEISEIVNSVFLKLMLISCLHIFQTEFKI